jgi:hypothetical protein
MEIGLVSCTADKRDEPATPRDLYDTSAYFRKMRDYAESHHDRWYVLSARHGLLVPDGDPVEPYEETLADATPAEQERWADCVFGSLWRRERLDADTTVVCHAGRDYTEPLRPLLAKTGATVENPTGGMRIGERLQWYDEHS